MKLVLLGTTGYHPNDRRHTPCMLIPECGVMLDAGTAVYRAGNYLQTDERYGTSWSRVMRHDVQSPIDVHAFLYFIPWPPGKPEKLYCTRSIRRALSPRNGLGSISRGRQLQVGADGWRNRTVQQKGRVPLETRT